MLLNEQEQQSFCKEFNITEEKFRMACLTWKELDEIACDFELKAQGHQKMLKEYVDKMQTCSYAHSFRYRVKDTQHLIEKIIRKNPKYLENGDSLSVYNYESRITDLLGIRILLLFKSDWKYVHEYLMELFGNDLLEPPFAYIRQGDDESLYQGKVEIRADKSYRSVHYVIRATNGIGIEVQVRTLYEEAWGEIDHRVRYPYNLDNKMVRSYVDIMNSLTGIGDEMGSFINEYMRVFLESKMVGVTSDNEVYQFILEKIEGCENNSVKQEIINKIRQAESYRESKRLSDLLQEALRF